MRKLAESCDKLGGFMIYSSFSGGQGSMFATLMNLRFPKTPVTYMSLFPDEGSIGNSPIEAYNFPSHIKETHEDSLKIMLTNKQLYSYCEK